MPYVKILIAAFLVLAVTGCSRGGPALDTAITTPCEHPADLLTDDVAGVIVRKLGDALYVCEQRRAAAVAAYEGIR